MEEVTKGYEDFIREKELHKNGKQRFEKAIAKAVTPKKKSNHIK